MQVDTDSLEYPQTVSSSARDFMKKLILKDPLERMPATRALNHPFLAVEDDS